MSVFTTISLLSSLYALIIMSAFAFWIFKLVKIQKINAFLRLWLDIVYLNFIANIIFLTNPINNKILILILLFWLYWIIFYKLWVRWYWRLIYDKALKNKIIEDIPLEPVLKEELKITENLKEDTKQDKYCTKCWAERKWQFCSECWSKFDLETIEKTSLRLKLSRITVKQWIIYYILTLIWSAVFPPLVGISTLILFYLIYKLLKYIFKGALKAENNTKATKINSKFKWWRYFNISILIFLIVWAWDHIDGLHYNKMFDSEFLSTNGKNIISDNNRNWNFDSWIFDVNNDWKLDTLKFDLNWDSMTDMTFAIINWKFEEDTMQVLDYNTQKNLLIITFAFILIFLMYKTWRIILDEKSQKIAVCLLFTIIFNALFFDIRQTEAIPISEVYDSLKSNQIWWGVPAKSLPKRAIYTKEIDTWYVRSDRWFDFKAPTTNKWTNDGTKSSTNTNIWVPPNKNNTKVDDKWQDWKTVWWTPILPNIKNPWLKYVVNLLLNWWAKLGPKEEKFVSTLNNMLWKIKSWMDYQNSFLYLLWKDWDWLEKEISNLNDYYYALKNKKIRIWNENLSIWDWNKKLVKQIENYRSKWSSLNWDLSKINDDITSLNWKIDKLEWLAWKWSPIKWHIEDLRNEMDALDSDATNIIKEKINSANTQDILERELARSEKKLLDNSTKISEIEKDLSWIEWVTKETSKLQKSVKALDAAWKALWAYNDYQEFKELYKWNNSRTIVATTTTTLVWSVVWANPVDAVVWWLAWWLALVWAEDASKKIWKFTAWEILKDTVKNALDDDEASIWWAVTIKAQELSKSQWIIWTSLAAADLWITATYAAWVYWTRKVLWVAEWAVSAVWNWVQYLWDNIW